MPLSTANSSFLSPLALKHGRTITAGLAVTFLFVALPAAAQNAPESGPAGWEQTRAKITELRTKARQLRNDAALQYGLEEKKCLQKFLASDCLDAARKARVAVEHQASASESEAQALERGIKAEQHAAQIVRNEEKSRKDAADAARRAEQARMKEEKNARRLEKKMAKEKPCPCDCPR